MKNWYVYNMKEHAKWKSQLQKYRYCMIQFVQNAQTRQIHWDKTHKLLPRSEEAGKGMGGNGGWLLTGQGFLWGDENVLKLIVVMVAQFCKYTRNH